MNKMRQIAKEFGEPFVDVVRGFAEMGYSRRATAKILNINLSYFRQLCDRLGLHQHFKQQRDMRDECKGHGKGWPKGKPQARRSRYTDAEILEEVSKYPVSTLFQSMAAIDISTVHRRFGGWTAARRLAHGD